MRSGQGGGGGRDPEAAVRAEATPLSIDAAPEDDGGGVGRTTAVTPGG